MKWLFLAAAVLLVEAQASGICSERTLTAQMLPGPDKWHELPDAKFEVETRIAFSLLFHVPPADRSGNAPGDTVHAEADS